jgi:hypothetical protein
MSEAEAEAQLEAFIAKFDDEVAAAARWLVGRLRARIPGAQVLVYDNYNALAIGFGPSVRAGQAVLSLAVFPRWVTLCFLQGAALPDPHRLLKGAGSRVRHVRLDPPERLDAAEVQALIDAALARAEPPFDPRGDGRLVIKSVSTKQRPRRASGQHGPGSLLPPSRQRPRGDPARPRRRAASGGRVAERGAVKAQDVDADTCL